MSLPRYSEYGSSSVPWVGQLPAHWHVKPLFGVAVERSESNAGMVENNLLSLSYGNIVRKDISSNDGLLPESFETYQVVCEGDIVLRLTDLQNDKRSLRSAVVRERGIITSAYLALRAVGVSPAYLSYLLRAYDLSKVFYSMGGGLRQSMKFSDLKRMPVVVPPTGEQAAIATFLDRETAKIDALIAEQEKLIALLAEKRQATISHAVTRGLNPHAPMKDSGVPWLGEVPAHWTLCAMRRVILKIEQGWSPECYAREAELHEWGVLKAGCLNGGEFQPSENKALPIEVSPESSLEVKIGDVLMSRASGSPELVGSTALVNETRPRLMLSDKIFRLRLQTEVHPAFFVAALKSKALRVQIENALSGGHGMANNLPQSSLLSFSVPIPPLAEQMGIAELIDVEVAKTKALMAKVDLATGLLRERRSALIAAAVTGQIDVRGIQPGEEPCPTH